MTDPREQIRKLLRLANDPGATVAEAATARRHASRLLGLLGLAEDAIGHARPREIPRAPGGPWGRYRTSSPCSGCPLEDKRERHPQCRTCDDRPRN